jgi:hypothetical protein
VSCPADMFASPGQACGNPPVGDCDQQDTCNSDGVCVDNLKSSTYECRSATSVCDIPESCSGASKECPADTFAPLGWFCGNPVQGVCDWQDSCDGSGTCVDRYRPSDEVCRPAVSQCDVAELCTGSTVDCPVDILASQGTFCDGAPSVGGCDQQNTCDSNGVCVDHYGSNADCDDGYSCTTDVCGAVFPHTCSHTASDLSCADNALCTLDVCVAADSDLRVTFGVPLTSSGCVNEPSVSRCNDCSCAPADSCSPASANAWSDGCVHRFGSSSGSVLPPIPNEQLTTCAPPYSKRK